MSDELHGDAGTELDHEGCPAIIDGSGQIRKLGAILVPGLRSSFPVFEDKFPRMTDDEIKAYIVNGRPKSGRHEFDSSWIADQGQFGSCNGWASAKALERARVRKGLPRVRLSGSSVYAMVNGGRDNGSIPEEAMTAMQSRGAVPESISSVNEIYERNYSAADWAEAKKYLAGECYATHDRQAYLTGLAMGFDGVIALQAGNNFMRLDSDGIAGHDSGPGNHANCNDDILLIGDKIVIDDANSWNKSYGTQGRAYITWESHLAQPSKSFAFFLIRTASDSPDGTNPPVVS